MLGVVVVVVPGVSSPKGSSSFVPRVSSPKRSSYLFLGVSSPKGSCSSIYDAALAIVLRSLGFRPPREAGAASMLLLLPAGEAPLSFPRVSSPRGRSSFFLGVSSPKGSWGGVDDAALASECRTAIA